MGRIYSTAAFKNSHWTRSKCEIFKRFFLFGYLCVIIPELYEICFNFNFYLFWRLSAVSQRRIYRTAAFKTPLPPHQMGLSCRTNGDAKKKMKNFFDFIYLHTSLNCALKLSVFLRLFIGKHLFVIFSKNLKRVGKE